MKESKKEYRVVRSLHVAVVEVRRLLKDERVVGDRRAEHVAVAGSEITLPRLHPVRAHEAVGDGVIDLARGGVVDAEREGVYVPLDDLDLVGGQVLHVQVVQLLSRRVHRVCQIPTVGIDDEVVHRYGAKG